MGHVTGGWEFIWAAYGISLAGLLLYGYSLYARGKEQK
jgi:hypothetical protein